MATQVQFRGGTTSEHSTFTGVAREVTVDTTKKTVVVHDGSTAGGIPLAKESAVTSAAAITGGSINGTTVGASTASTGAFTTLSASSTVSGTGFSTYLASPPAIGGTTASTGRFTTVTATGLTSGRVTYAGASGLLSDSANLTFDGTKLTSAGLVSTGALNVSGSGWGVLPYVANSLVVDSNAGETRLFATGTNTSTQGNFLFYTGTTNGTASERMRITSAGNVGIGTSSQNERLRLNSSTAAQARMSISYADSTISFYGSYSGITGTGNATDTFLSSANVLAFGSGGTTERMRIDSSGNLGLGVTPSAWGTSGAVFKAMEYGVVGNAIAGISNGSSMDTMSNAYYNSGWKYANSSRPALRASLNGDVSGAFTWNQAASGTAGAGITWTQAMTLDASGNLLVGTTSTTVNPGIVVYGGINNAQIQIGHASGVASGEGYLGFQYNGSAIGSITQSGTTGVLYNVTSDQRLKTNIVDAPSGNIDGIKVRSFDWVLNGNHQEYGMVAQELLEVAPYAVTKPKNPDDMMQVDYSKLVPMMIKEIQDLKTEVNQLKTKIGV